MDHDEIAHDYHLTAAAMADFISWLAVEFPEAVDSMSSQPKEYLEAPVEAMQGFLAEVDVRYGSMEGLVDALGVGPATVAASGTSSSTATTSAGLRAAGAQESTHTSSQRRPKVTSPTLAA